MVNRRDKTSGSTRNKIQQFVCERSLDWTEVCLICVSLASSSPCVLWLKWNKRSLDGKITANFYDHKLKSWMFEEETNCDDDFHYCYSKSKFVLINDWCALNFFLHALKGLQNIIVMAESRLVNESRTTAKLMSRTSNLCVDGYVFSLLRYCITFYHVLLLWQ